MIGIDLFSGAGGMSLGAKMAGIDVQVVVEADKYAAETYLHNHEPKFGVFADDIRKFNKIEINNKSPCIVFGGPPCQGFSTSNQKTRTKENLNNWLFKEFIRVAKEYKPEWIVFENVKGILETAKGAFVNEILNSFNSLGYSTSFKVLNASDFGVPQNRSRFFIVASSKNIKFKFPTPHTNKCITLSQALDGLPLLENGANKCELPYPSAATSCYANKMRQDLSSCKNHLVTKNNLTIIERYKHIPQGGNWENIPEELMENYKDRSRCHTGIYKRLHPDLPSVVIGNYRKNMLIHPFQNRGLSVREAARIQSFPDWFEFKGSIGFQQQQVGNAVPPLLAKALFDEILKYDM